MRTLIIPDLQIPYEHPDALAFCHDTYLRWECDSVVNAGDELDLHTFGRWVQNPDLYSPGHELEEAKRRIAKWYDIFPDMLLCNSNHVDRLAKKAKSAGIPSQCLRPLGEILETPKWKWAPTWEIDGVHIEHGHELFNGGWSVPKGALRMAPEKRWRSTVFGHTHSKFGIEWIRTPAGRFFGMGVGCLVDEDSPAFDYAGAKHAKSFQLGCGVLIDGLPYLEPMLLDKKGRWVGR